MYPLNSGRLEGVRVPKTAELVAGMIRRQIVLGRLAENDILPPESTLMQEFAVSRPSLREAVRILEAEGLITIHRGARGGARVLAPSADVAARYAGLLLQNRGTPLSDVLDARIIVESPAARMLAERRDHRKVAKHLESVIASFDPNVPGSFDRFNAALIESTESPTLILLAGMLEHIGHAAALNYARSRGTDLALAEKTRKAWTKVIAHISEGDADSAEARWRAYLTASGEVLTKSVGNRLIDLFDPETNAGDESRRVKAGEELANQLRRQIVTGELASNELLPAEPVLMEKFDVSRPTLREAFRVLESEGLLEINRGARGGARVQVPTVEVIARYAGFVLEYRRATITDVDSVRTILEAPCVAAIGARNDKKAIAKLREAIETAENGPDDTQRLHAQLEFHPLLVALAGNQSISVLHGAINSILEIADRRASELVGAAAQTAQHEGARSHRKLIELLEAGDAAGAERLWRKHIEATKEFHVNSGGPTALLALL